MDNRHILEWFRFGDNDLVAAEHLAVNLRPQPLEIICYHCQQAVAKCNALNAYGVQPRYPDEVYIDEEQTRKALVFAGEIRDFEPLAAVRAANNNQQRS